MFCYQVAQSFGHHLHPFHCGLEDITPHIEALSKFTQKTLNNSWKILFLLHTDVSKIQWPWTLLLSHKRHQCHYLN